nr:MAG TPA: hypothetical protein [Caudoviricetes sp.]
MSLQLWVLAFYSLRVTGLVNSYSKPLFTVLLL